MALKLPTKKDASPKHKGPSEIVAIDIGSTGLKAVRLKAVRDVITVLGADILPPLPAEAAQEEDGSMLTLPKAFRTYYAALTITGENTIIRHLSLPNFSEQPEAAQKQIMEHLGLEGDYRLGYVRTTPPQRKGEVRVLAAALQEEDASRITSLVAGGSPAPVALEISGLSATNGFMARLPEIKDGEGIGFVEGGARVTLVALFTKGAPALIRKFDFGAEALIQKVEHQMNVDRDVAEGIVSDGSFDISQAVKDVLDPFLRQLTISRDFVERRENVRISKLYLSGGMGLSRYWKDELARSTGVEIFTWNPFEGYEIAPDALPEAVVGQEARFGAAMGVAHGALTAS